MFTLTISVIFPIIPVGVGCSFKFYHCCQPLFLSNFLLIIYFAVGCIGTCLGIFFSIVFVVCWTRISMLFVFLFGLFYLESFLFFVFLRLVIRLFCFWFCQSGHWNLFDILFVQFRVFSYFFFLSVFWVSLIGWICICWSRNLVLWFFRFFLCSFIFPFCFLICRNLLLFPIFLCIILIFHMC